MATIALEERVGIPAEIPEGKLQRFYGLPPPIPQKVRVARFVSDLGSLDEMRSGGVTHVAVAEGRYSSSSRKGGRPHREKKSYSSERPNFLLAPVRRRPAGLVAGDRQCGALNPNLRLHEINLEPAR